MGAFELLLEKEEGMPSPDFKDKKALLFKKKKSIIVYILS